MWKAIVSVIDFSHAPLAPRAVLMNIAEEVDWPACTVTRSEAYFAEKLHISERQFRRHITELQRLGELVCERRHSRYTKYTIPLLPGETDRYKETKERRETYKRIESERKEQKAAQKQQKPAPEVIHESEELPEEEAAAYAEWLQEEKGEEMGVPLPRQPQDLTAWTRARDLLSRSMPKPQFDNWIAPLHFQGMRRFTSHSSPTGQMIGLDLLAPSRDHARVVNDRFDDLITGALAEVLNIPQSIIMYKVHFTRKPQTSDVSEDPTQEEA